jgi:hypothetical protein
MSQALRARLRSHRPSGTKSFAHRGPRIKSALMGLKPWACPEQASARRRAESYSPFRAQSLPNMPHLRSIQPWLSSSASSELGNHAQHLANHDFRAQSALEICVLKIWPSYETSGRRQFLHGSVFVLVRRPAKPSRNPIRPGNVTESHRLA